MSEAARRKEQRKKDFDALLIMGLFLGVFGLAVLVAVFYTPTFHGRVVNLISGGVLVLIGAGAIYKGRFSKREG